MHRALRQSSAGSAQEIIGMSTWSTAERQRHKCTHDNYAKQYVEEPRSS